MDNSNNAGAAGLVLLLIWLLLAVGMLLWYLWAMARLFPRIGLKAGDGWIPIWNQWKLLERTGLPGWVVLLGFVGLGIVPFIMLIIAMHRLGEEYGASAGYTVLGALIPPLWATLFANVVDEAGGVPIAGYTNYLGAVSASGGYTAAVQQGFALPPEAVRPAPTAFAPPSAQPAAPPVAAPPSAAPPSAAPGAQLPWAPAAPPGGSIPPAFAPPGGSIPPAFAPPAAVPPASAPPLGSDTEAEYDRLAAEGFQTPPASPLGQRQPPASFSWAEASAEQAPRTSVIPPVPPVVLPPAPPTPSARRAPAPPAAQVPAAVAVPLPPADSDFVRPAPTPAVHKPTGITGKFDPLPPAAANADYAVDRTGGGEDPMDLDRTVLVPRHSAPGWVLELPDGTKLPLFRDVVIGRKPESVEGSATLTVPDSTRTLSKSHARLVLDGERWLVEDLGSTNGLVLLNQDGSESELSPGVRVEAVERMLFGTLEVRLRRDGGAA